MALVLSSSPLFLYFDSSDDLWRFFDDGSTLNSIQRQIQPEHFTFFTIQLKLFEVQVCIKIAKNRLERKRYERRSHWHETQDMLTRHIQHHAFLHSFDGCKFLIRLEIQHAKNSYDVILYSQGSIENEKLDANRETCECVCLFLHSNLLLFTFF